MHQVCHKRGIAYAEKGQYDKAIFDYDIAIEINQGCAEAYNGKAWILATCRDAVYRDGAKAVDLAKRAVELSSAGVFLDTLPAAYAEVGKFEDAIKYLEMWSRQKKYGKLVISFTNGTITSVRYENVMTDEQIIGELGSGRKIHVRRIESTE